MWAVGLGGKNLQLLNCTTLAAIIIITIIMIAHVRLSIIVIISSL